MLFSFHAWTSNFVFPPSEKVSRPNCVSAANVVALTTFSPSFANISIEERSTKICKRRLPLSIARGKAYFLAKDFVKAVSVMKLVQLRRSKVNSASCGSYLSSNFAFSNQQVKSECLSGSGGECGIEFIRIYLRFKVFKSLNTF